jgi:hypothetical protein
VIKKVAIIAKKTAHTGAAVLIKMAVKLAQLQWRH